MGLVRKGDNEKQRKRMATQSMKDLMEDSAAREKTPPSRDEVKCQNCGFKARYQFVRCPQCNSVKQ